MVAYNSMELMICVASRLLEDGSTVGVGTGAPLLAAMLAQKLYAPDLFLAFEAGGLAPQLVAMPMSVGDSRSFHRALMATSMGDIMDACQRGMMDYTFLGGAQIDAYGNLNSTVIGDHAAPKVRFPGSGGAKEDGTGALVAELSRICPNPLNSSATIRYSVPEASSVTVTLYDVLGKEVAKVVNSRMEAGEYMCTLEVGDLSNGVYFLRLQAGVQSDTQKIVVLK